MGVHQRVKARGGDNDIRTRRYRVDATSQGEQGNQKCGTHGGKIRTAAAACRAKLTFTLILVGDPCPQVDGPLIRRGWILPSRFLRTRVCAIP